MLLEYVLSLSSVSEENVVAPECVTFDELLLPPLELPDGLAGGCANTKVGIVISVIKLITNKDLFLFIFSPSIISNIILHNLNIRKEKFKKITITIYYFLLN